MTGKPILALWESYAREVVPKDAGPIQRQECRRAFFAGVAMGHALTFAATDAADEDQCVKNLEVLEAEIAEIPDLEMLLEATMKAH